MLTPALLTPETTAALILDYAAGFASYLAWYSPEIEGVRERLAAGRDLVTRFDRAGFS